MPRLRFIRFALLTSAVLVHGCSPGQAPASATRSATIAATPTSNATAAASTPAPGSPADTDSASASVAGGPPPAYLSHDATVIAGALRTYCWLDTCVDALELPPMGSLPMLRLGSSVTPLGLRLGDEVAFINWRASYGNGDMDDLRPLDHGGEEFDPDTTASLPPLLSQAAIATPPPGDWIVYVVIGSIEGEGHYAWQVSVP